MSKKHKQNYEKQSDNFNLVDGQPMTPATQWFLIGAVSATAAIKIIEASVNLTLETALANPGFTTSNFWLSLLG